MRSRPPYSAALALLVLLLFCGILLNRYRGGDAPRNEASPRTLTEEATTEGRTLLQREEVRERPAADPKVSGEAEFSAASTSLARGRYNQLRFGQPRTETRDNSREFAPDLFQLRAGDPVGPLTVNEHTLSAVEANFNASLALKLDESDDGTFRLPLSRERSIVVKIERVITRSPVTRSFVGKVDGDPLSEVTMVFHDGAVSGSVALFAENEHYEFGMAGNGDVAIRRLDPSTYTAGCGMPEGAAIETSAESAGEDLLPDALEDPDLPGSPAGGEEEPSSPEAFMAVNTIDTVIGYGVESRTAEGGVAAMEARIIASVDRTNTTFLNSLIADAELVLLATVEDPEYDSPGMIPGTMGSQDELGRLNDPDDGFFDVITDLRDLLGADQAGLIVNTTQGGAAGIAYITGRSMIVTRTFMSTAAYTFVHELGHNLGCKHAWGDGGGASSTTTEHRYGWRFVGNSSTQFRTVMAYDSGWTRLPRFSDPDLLHDGVKTGATDGYDASGDSAVDPRLVSGGYTGNEGAGYDGTNPSLGARNADYINANILTMVNRATRAAPVSGPEITVRQSGVDLTSGVSSVDFGAGSSDLTVQRSFVVHNSGDSTLTGLNLSIFFGNGDFGSDSAGGNFPASLPPQGSEILTVEFSPDGVGAKSATLRVHSDDSDEPFFDVALTGTGVTPASNLSDDFDPDLDVALWGTLGASIAANTGGQGAGAGSTGNSLWFGGDGNRVAQTIPIDTSSGGTASFLVAEAGVTATNWEMPDSGEELHLFYSTDGTVFHQLAGPFDSTTWQQQTIPVPAAAQSAATVFRFEQLRHSGGSFDNFAIEDLVISTPPAPAPDITIEYPVGTPLTDGGSSIDFGLPFSNRDFTIRNDGDANLTGVSLVLSNLEFAAITHPSSTIAPGGTSTFRIRFLPDGGGTRSTQLLVQSNDPDEDPFIITLTGTGEAFPTYLFDDFDPDLDGDSWSTVGLGITANDFANAPGTGPSGNQFWFGGSNSSRYVDSNRVDTTAGGAVSFYFAAGDDSTANWDSLESGDEMVLEYSLTGLTFTQMAGPFSNTTWTYHSIPIPPAAQSEGTYFRFRQLANSGVGTDHFAIDDVSIGIDPSAPEITLEQPAGTNLADESATIDFGTLEVGQSASLEFTVGNIGDADLTGLGITIDGTASGDFQVTADPTAPVSPAGSTTFTVEFAPSTHGARTAQLHLDSNDADEDPFDVTLTGMGQSPPPSLTGLSLGAGPLTPAFGPATTSYGATVPFSTTSTTVTPTATDPGTAIQVRINGAAWNPVTSGSPSPGLPVIGGLNSIEIELTSADGLATTNYSIGFTPGRQLISFSSPGTQPISAGPISLGATSSSGLPVNYSLVSGGTIVGLTGNTVTLTGGTGVVTIRASQAGNGEYDPAEDVYTSFRVVDGLPFTKVAGKLETLFAIRSDGTLWATGAGFSYGALGTGARENRFSLTQIGSDNDWADVSPGWRHTHGIKSDGTLWGWGYAYGSRLYTLPSGYVLSPTQIGTESGWSRVFAGESHSLALKTDGTLWGWGVNSYGELGPTGTGQIGTDTDWATASAGLDFSVVIKTDGTLWTFGRNNYGQLGTGDTTNLSMPTQVGSDTDWESVSAGFYYILATKTDGSLWGWGWNNSGMLGTGDTADHHAPVRIGTANDWEEVAAGSTSSYGRKSDDTLWAWGSNFLGSLGTGSSDTINSTPTQIGTGRGWATLGANSGSGHAIDTEGIIWSWGSRLSGRTGHGIRKPMNVASSLGALDHVAIGRFHVLGVRSDKTLWSWGRNVNGVLGGGSSGNQTGPGQVGTSSNWESAAAGYYHSIGIRDDGTLWAWGDDRSGFLGLGNTGEIQSAPMQVGSGTSWESASAGYSYTLAIQDDGSLWAWGEGSSGQLGDGTSTDQTSPVRVGTDNNWSRVSTGYQHSAAIRDDGSLWTWGSNSSGRLGDGTVSSKNAPNQVGTDTDWLTASAGFRHTAAVKTDGSLWTWGYNRYGELGDGTTTEQRSPVRIGPDDVWVDVRAGDYFTLALKSNGTLWAWGLNQQGVFTSELPDRSLIPRQVTSFGSWSRLPDQTTGSIFSNFFAIASDGSLWGWGEPSYSMLAETLSDHKSPQPSLPLVEQNLVFPAVTIPPVGQSVTLNATTESGLPIRYLVDGPATISGNELTVTGTGPVTVLAHQPGDSVWNAAGPVANGGNADLSDLSLSLGTLDPGFQSSVATYTATLPSAGIASITATPTLADANAAAEIQINGGGYVAIAPGAASDPLSLQYGENPVQIRVTAENGVTTRVYLVTVTRPIPSSDAGLSGLTLNGHPFDPAFDPAVLSYTSLVPLSTGDVTVTPTLSDINAMGEVQVNGGGFIPVASGSPSGPLALQSGSNLVQVRVTAEDGVSTRIYALTVEPGGQRIDFPSIDPQSSSGAPFALSAMATSGLPVSYSIVTGGGIASVSGNTVTLSGSAGPVTVRASQGGDANYVAAPDAFASFYVQNAAAEVVEIALGRFSNVIRKSDGTLWSQGYNNLGQLGDGTRIDKRDLEQIGADSDWQAISTGYYHGLALKSNGTLWAWGYNSSGRLGDGTSSTRTSPVQIGTDTNWQSIAAGDDYSLGIKTDGTLWSWGANSSGQLGNGTTTSESSPVQIGSDTNWSKVSAGDRHTLALKTNGSLWAWGYNSSGRLGDGTTAGQLSPIQIGTDTNWQMVSAGWQHSLAIKSDGSLWAWGSNGSGRLGDGSMTNRLSPVQIGTDTNWEVVSGGLLHTLARKSDGTLWVWGDNGVGQLGDTSGIDQTTPVQFGAGSDWQVIPGSMAAAYGNLAFRGDGFLWAWGGNSTTRPWGKRNPVPFFANLGPTARVSVGDDHTVAIKGDGTLWSWGDNFSGKLGDGTTIDRQSPAQIGVGTDWQVVAAGDHHTLALKAGGTLWAWGESAQGQLGDGNTADQRIPFQIGTDTNWASIQAGDDHSVGLKTDGTLWAWGHNQYGQVGDGTTTNVLSPTQVGTDTDWQGIAAGDRHTLAIRTNGTLWAWGDNNAGQLGDGTTTDQLIPQQVGVDTDWQFVTGGNSHSLAIRTDGTLWAWGSNSSGRLGDGTFSRRLTPVQIGTGTDWQSVVAGFSHTMALKTNGTLWTWGENNQGRLADGTYEDRNSPVQIGVGDVWSSLPQGGMSQTDLSLAATVDGSLWGWGDNGQRLFGDASFEVRVPRPVIPLTQQTISFPNVVLPAVGQSVTLTASASSGLPVHYLVSGPAEIAGTELTVTGPGNVTVAAYQPGDDVWDSTGPAVLNSDTDLSDLLSSEGPLSPVFDPGTTDYSHPVLFGTTSLTVTPTASDSLAVIELQVNGGVYTSIVSGATSAPLTINPGANRIDVRVTARNGVSQKIYTVAVARPLVPDPQTIDFSEIAPQFTSAGPFQLGGTSSSGLPVSFSILAGGNVASVSGDQVTLTGNPGAVTVKASQPGDPDFGAAPDAFQTFKVIAGPGFREVAAGSVSTMAIRTDGTLWASGNNYLGSNAQGNVLGRLGDGTLFQHSSMIQVGSDNDWLTVARSSNHTLALKNDGSLWAWGSNFGRLGDGTTTSRQTPTRIGSENDWEEIATGSNHSVALKTDGTLWAWGSNNIYGQIGDGTTAFSRSPKQIGSDSDWKTITAGYYHTLAVKDDGTLWVWGRNSDGQLGDGGTTDLHSPTQIGIETNWSSVSGGISHSLALKSDGTLWAWGDNFSGKLGDGTELPRLFPVQIGGDTDWMEISAGGAHSRARKSDNTLWSWGYNAYGQLGDGTRTTRLVPTQIGIGIDWTQTNTKSSSNAGLSSDGMIWSSGFSLYGQLGQGVRTPVPALRNFGAISQLSLGRTHSAAVRTDGTLWSWGANFDGQLGDGTTDPSIDPVQVGASTNWEKVAVGSDHTVAIRSDGTIWAWGDNTNGYLGDGNMIEDQTNPVQVGVDFDWDSVSAGDRYTIALKSDGTLWAWGYNYGGVLGDGSTTSTTAPAQIGFDTDWAFVSAGYTHVLAIKTDGTLWAWGRNFRGQLGDGSTSSKSSPVQIGTDTDWQIVSTGYEHTAAIKTNGTLWVWGENSDGRLGDGSTIDQRNPVQIGAETNWQEVQAGEFHTVARKGDNTLWAWGANPNGEAGNGSEFPLTLPSQVGAEAIWTSLPTAIMGRVRSTMATSADGTIWGWGDSSYGQMAEATPDFTTPRPAFPPEFQTIIFPNFTLPGVGGSVTLDASASSGLPVEYIVDGPATLSGNDLTVTGAGPVTVLAYQPGDSVWNAAGPVAIGGNADLSDLTLSMGTLTPGFQSSVASYTTTLPSAGITSITATPTLVDANATAEIQVNGGGYVPIASGAASDPLSMQFGGNPVQIRVTAQNGTTMRVYTVNVIRPLPSSDAGLSGLTLNGHTLDPAFDPAVPGYTSLVPLSTGSVMVTPTLSDSNAMVEIQVNGGGFSPVASGSPSGPLALQAGSNLIQARVTAEDGVSLRIYSLSVIPGGQRIDFPPIDSRLSNGAPFALSAMATSGLPVSYSIVAGGGIASVSGDNITLSGAAGPVTVRASQGGDADYVAAPDAFASFYVQDAGADVVEIGVGSNFNLVRKSDGTLWSWGYNGSGQLGDGSFATNRDPKQMGPDSDWRAISAGTNHALALKDNGTLWAWGSNGSGRLGDGTTTSKNTPVQITPASDWQSIGTGDDFSLAIKTNGTLWAWGENSSDQLGDGTGTDQLSPVQIGLDTDWLTVSAGDAHVLALKTDGTLWAWGYNGSGRLGDGTSTSQPTPVQIGSDTDWQTVFAGSEHSMGIKADGTLWAWGYNNSGRLGDGTSTSRTSPVQIGADTDWLGVAAGNAHTMARKNDGTLWVWGDNVYGQLGDGTLTDQRSPVQFGTRTDWAVIPGSLAGSFSNLASRTGGFLWAWGGNNSAYPWGKPVPVPILSGLGNPAQVAIGDNHTVAIKDDGTLWAWGDNGSGRLGNGTQVDEVSPIQIGSDGNWHAVSAGDLHSLGLKTDGTLWAWGESFTGQLGDGNNVDQHSPVQIGTGADWMRISTGDDHSLGLKANGTLWAWGDNVYGQLGDGTTTDRFSPVRIGAAMDWRTVTAGDRHNLAIRTDGTLWAWGDNNYGQLGGGTTTDQPAPVQIGTDTDWQSVSGGDNHSLAIKSDGTLWAWGDNPAGQLGDGTTTDRHSPVQVGIDSDWQSVVATDLHSMALKSDGTLWAWGNNSQGRLGNGAFVNQLSPVQVGSLSLWSALPVGGMSQTDLSMAVTADGTLWGWGDNGQRLLADTSLDLRIPRPVVPLTSQTVVFPDVILPSPGASVTLTATSSSGLPVGYLVIGPATLAGNELTVTGPDEIILAAYQAGDNVWDSAAPVVAQTFRPEITIEQPVGNSLTDGSGAVAFPDLLLGQNAVKTFTVRNDGTDPLTGLSISKDGSHAGDFTAGPLSATNLNPGETATFDVTFAPGALGARVAAIHVASNDPDENPFDVLLNGNGVAPEIVVEQPAGTGLADGAATIDFGGVPLSSTGDQIFTVRNIGTGPLTGLALTKSGAQAGDFSLGSLGATTLAPGESTTFTVTFTPGAAGSRAGALALASSDIDEDPFDIALSGIGLAPEVSVAAAAADRPEGSSGVTPFTFTVSRSGYINVATTVDFSVSGSVANPADAADFGGALPGGMVSFVPNEASKTVTINVSGDGILESDEEFVVILSNPSGGATLGSAMATGAIRNDDVLTIMADTVSPGDDEAIEAGASGVVTLSHNHPGRATPVPVSLNRANSVANDSEYFLSGGGASFSGGTGTVTIPGNETSVALLVTAVSELKTEAETDETVVLEVLADGYAVGTPATAIVTIEQNGFLVTNTGDFDPVVDPLDGTGTLRQAILNANELGGTPAITFDASVPPFGDAVTPDTITLTNGQLTILENLTIQGLGARAVEVSGGDAFGVFEIGAGNFNVTFEALTVRNGAATEGAGIRNQSSGLVRITNSSVRDSLAINRGGGIINQGGGDLVISDSTVSGNRGVNTGGILAENGTITIVNSTITGNTAINSGAGGLGVESGGAIELTNVTIADNSSPVNGGGLHNNGGMVAVGNTLIAGNHGPAGSPDISGNGVTSQGNNLVGDSSGTAGVHGFTGPDDQAGTSGSPIDAKLMPLSDNGGPADTHGLSGASPAIDRGSDALTIASGIGSVDQRGSGFDRFFDRDGDGTADVDIGALEIGLPQLWINEIEADDEGADDGEFVEIYDGGVGDTDLASVVLVLFDGATDQSYWAISLAGFATDADGYFVIGNAGVLGVDAIFADAPLQEGDINGSDAVALFVGTPSSFPNGTAVSTTGLIDAVVYKTSGQADDPGLAGLLNGGEPQLDDDARGNEAGHSLQRFPNGSGGQRNTASFEAIAPTPGAENLPPAAPSDPDLDTTSDTGVSGSDDITRNDLPTLTGTGTPGALLVLTSDRDGAFGTTPVDAAGEWSFAVSGTALSQNVHQITAQADPHAQTGTDGTSAALTLTIDTTSPAVTVEQGGSQADPTNVEPVLFTATFSEAVNGFESGDVTVSGTAGAMTAEVAPSGGTTFEISATGATGDGTVVAVVDPGAVEDAAGNQSQASTSVDNSVLLVSDLETPTGVAASDLAFSNKIEVTWSPVSTADSYDVLRSSTNVFGSASVVGSVSGATSFSDTSATGAPDSYFYWVVAKKTVSGVMRESSPGGPDSGQRAVDQQGDTPGSATAVTLDGNGRAMVGGTLEPGDTDYFKLELTDPYHVSIFTAGGVDTLGELSDDAQQVLNSPSTDDDAGIGENFRIEIPLAPGTYFIKVTPKGANQSGVYDLNIELGDPAAVQPDFLVGRTLATAVGGDVYDGLQRVVAVSKKARAVRSIFAVENDGEVPDGTMLMGTRSNRLFTVTYTFGGANVTGAMTSGQYETDVMEPGDAPVVVNVLIRPKRSKLKKTVGSGSQSRVKWLKKRITLTLTGKSLIDESKSDKVQLQIRTK